MSSVVTSPQLPSPDPWAYAADLLDPPHGVYLDDPCGWVWDRLQEFLWSKQREILEAVRDHRLTAVRSCHDAGKSFTASRAVAWWLDVHPPGEAFVVTTAPSFAQVRAVLWREIGRAHRKGGLVGKVNQTEWWIDDEIVAFGRKPADYDPGAFQGIHARYVLVVLDEADAIPPALWGAARALATNEHCRVLAIGNPDDPTSEFAKVCQPGSGWHPIHINGFETPNFTDEQIPDELRESLLSRVWVEETRRDYGEHSPYWVSKVLGEHPVDATDGVVPISALRACQHATEGVPTPETELWAAQDLVPVELGVDVGASAGGDQSVIYARFGKRARLIERCQTPVAGELAERIVQAIRTTGAGAVKIDATGVGWAVGDLVENLCHQQGVPVPQITKVMVGQSSSRPNRFAKLRDQIWWEIGRELSEQQGWDLSEVDEACIAQLVAPRYEPDASGRTKVEKKDETRKRLGRSPDDADALLLAFFVGWQPGVAVSSAHREL